MKFIQGKITKKILYVVSFVVLLIVIVLFGTYVIKPAGQSITSNAQIAKPIDSQTLNKSFTFPIKDDKGVKVGEVKYTLQSVDIRKEVYIKGQLAKSITGKEFLIVNIKLENNFNKAIKINARDFLRLSRNNNQNEWIAPTIHNDPVETQAISTEFTRVGFVVSENDKNFVLRVGEIDGEKQPLKLDL